tara:strand:- start:49 stop:189 length:141 start_codon:yes stop_codon:yes gene_type:complete
MTKIQLEQVLEFMNSVLKADTISVETKFVDTTITSPNAGDEASSFN